MLTLQVFFGNNDVSIAQVVQKSRKDGVAELVIITDDVAEKNFNDAMTVFNGLSVVKRDCWCNQGLLIRIGKIYV